MSSVLAAFLEKNEIYFHFQLKKGHVRYELYLKA